MRSEQRDVHLRELDGRHRTGRTAAQLVGDVAPSRAAEHAEQVRGTGFAQEREPLPARQRLFLHVTDRRHRIQDLDQHFRRESGAHRLRHVLQHDGGSADRARDLAEECDLLARAGPIRRHRDHHRRRAVPYRLGSQPDGGLRILARGADDHRHASVDFSEHHLRQLAALLRAQFAHLARDTGIGDTVDAAAQEVARQSRERIRVRRTGLVEGRRQHGKHAVQTRGLHASILPWPRGRARTAFREGSRSAPEQLTQARSATQTAHFSRRRPRDHRLWRTHVARRRSLRHSESGAILEYLGAKYGPTPLAPTVADATYPAYISFLHFGEGSLSAPLNVTIGSMFFAPEDQKQNWGSSFAIDSFVRKSAALVEPLRRGPYLTGATFTAADIACGYALGLARFLGVTERLDPVLRDYADRLAARPAYQRASSQQQPVSH